MYSKNDLAFIRIIASFRWIALGHAHIYKENKWKEYITRPSTWIFHKLRVCIVQARITYFIWVNQFLRKERRCTEFQNFKTRSIENRRLITASIPLFHSLSTFLCLSLAFYLLLTATTPSFPPSSRHAAKTIFCCFPQGILPSQF